MVNQSFLSFFLFLPHSFLLLLRGCLGIVVGLALFLQSLERDIKDPHQTHSQNQEKKKNISSND